MKRMKRISHTQAIAIADWLRSRGEEYVAGKTQLQLADEYSTQTGAPVATCTIGNVLAALGLKSRIAAARYNRAQARNGKAHSPPSPRVVILTDTLRHLYDVLGEEMPADFVLLCAEVSANQQ